MTSPTGSLVYAVAKRVLGSRRTRRFAWARWGHARLIGLTHAVSVYGCTRVEWDAPGHARVITDEIPGPAADEVLIRTFMSAVSPGTERAHFRLEPNAIPSFPHYPGYSLAGEVWRTGRNVSELATGQLVAAKAPHASLVAVRAKDVFPVPPGVGAEEAAYLFLGMIALHGIWRSGLRPGERVAVLGRGVVGQLTVQLASALGAGQVTSIAPSLRHLTSSLSRFTDRVVATGAEGREALSGIRAHLTFESSGSPRAVKDAVEATRDGGRVVLLGSARGATQGFDFGILADRNITLLGAHVGALLDRNSRDDHGFRTAGDTFLSLLSSGALDVCSLSTAEVDPMEAGAFYRQLARDDRASVGVLLRWDRLHEQDRAVRVNYFSAPNMDAVHKDQMQETIFQRTFLSESTDGQARLPMPRPVITSGNARSTLGVAVIGCGVRGAAQASVCQQTQSTRLELVMDSQQPLARGLGEKLGTRWAVDYEDVLSDDRIDAVFICSPHHLHADQAIQAIEAEKHVIVEKPLASDLEGAVRMVRAARGSSVCLSPWLGYRYLPQVVRAKDLFDQGVVGDLLGAHLTYHRLKPVHYSGQSPDGSPGWRGRWDTAGGGVLIMSGIHYLDWLLYFAALRVREVSCAYGSLDGRDEVEDALTMWLRFENGALASVDVASCVPGFHRQDDAYVECRLWGTDGHVSLTPPFQFFSSRVIDGKRPERWHRLGPLPKLRNRDVEYLDRFARAVLGGRPPEISADDGLHLQAVIEAAYRSGREGRPVSVEYPEL